MNRRVRLATAAALAGIACASGASAQDPAFRQVLVEPVAVAYRPGWLRDVNHRRALSERFTAPEAARLADALGQELQESLAEAFRARGLAAASRPGEGVLRVAGRIESLDVHAPGQAPIGGRTYIRRPEAPRSSWKHGKRPPDALLGSTGSRPPRAGSATISFSPGP